MGFVRFLIGTSPVILIAVSLAAPALAAQSKLDSPVPQARETDVDFGVTVAYDSNVARSDRAIADSRHLTLADEIASPSANFVLARKLGRTIVFLKGDGSYDFHRVNTRRDHENFDIGGGAAGRFGPCQESVVGNYGLLQSDIADLSAGVVSNIRESEEIKASATCGRQIGLAPNASVSQSWINNSDRVLQGVDSRSFVAEAGLAYQRPAFGSVSVFGQFVKTSYPHRLNVLTGGVLASSFDIYAGGLKYERHLGTRIDASLSVSYTSLSPSTAGGAAFHGLTFSLDSTYKLSKRVTLHASAIRATVPTNRIFANYKLDETYDADISYQLGSRLTLKLAGERTSSNYEVGPATPRIGDLTRETTYTGTASATFDLTKRFSFVASAGEERREANFAGLSYSSTKVTLGARAKF